MNNLNRNGKILAVTLDHGLTIGPIPGLINMNETVNAIQKGGASAMVAHKGIFKILDPPVDIGKIVHLSASTSLSVFPDDKVIVGSAELSQETGADAISIHVNIGSKHDRNMIEDLGLIADECTELNMPLLAMMYPRGENIPNPFDPKVVAHVARIGAELGADIVKTYYCEDFNELIGACPVPVVIAGGKKVPELEALKFAHNAVSDGAAGVDMGRNIFQSNSPENMIQAVRSVVVNGVGPKEAYEKYKSSL